MEFVSAKSALTKVASAVSPYFGSRDFTFALATA